MLNNIKEKFSIKMPSFLNKYLANKTLGESLDPAMKKVNGYIALAKEYLAPLINYYNSRSQREKSLIKLGGFFAIGYALLYMVVFPYLNYRQEVIASLDHAYEEFVWLSSQKERVSEIILSRGGNFNEELNINDLATQYASGAQVELIANDEYQISMSDSRGTAFFNAIQAIINRGGELLSIELSRAESQESAELIARIKI